jgi:uncharacterized protein DUF4249
MSKYLPTPFVKSRIFFYLFLFIGVGCETPVDLNFPTADAKLVVDGFITNVEKEHLVRLSYSSGFNEAGINVPDRIDNAFVQIIDNTGNRIQLIYRELGDYYTPLFKAEPGRSYKIEVQVDGASYESNFQQLPEYTESTKIRYEPSQRQVLSSTKLNIKNQRGIGIYVEIDKVNDQQVYYQWLQENWHVFVAPEAIEGSDFPNRVCYVRDFYRPQTDLYTSLPNGTSNNIELELDFIEPTNYQYHDYAVKVYQLIMNQDAYNYWNAIKVAYEGTGSLFDPAPYPIKGNIESEDDKGALGFFGAHNESSAAIFYNNCELPLNYRRQLYECDMPGPDLLPEHKMNHDCLSCLAAYGRSSQLKPPAWWRPFQEGNECDGD